MNKDFNGQVAENGELHTSDGGGYASVFHQTTENVPLDFSAALNRDPEDVLTISSLLRAVWVLLFVLAASVVMNVFLAVRRADRIVVDKSSGRVVELNNRDYGATETVEMMPDRPNDTDKKYLVKEFLKSLYAVEQTTREREINKLLRMLDPDLSLSFAAKLKQNGTLAAEKAESVNSMWELQDLSVDERDPYVLRALGIRRVRRKAGGQDVEETVQLKCKFLLKDAPTSPARNDNNLRTGFTILRFRVEPVNGKSSSPIVLLADGETIVASEISPPNKSADSPNQPNIVAEPKQ
jgi:hypothetical protein